jgi:NTE family protein
MNSHRQFRVQLGILLGIVFLAFPGPYSRAENSEPEKQKDRPTIGLVLSGGGARGAAHIGVLEVLQEMNVPIDYVTGTSMGSIVGALFSVGLQPDEIRSSVVGVDWDDLFNDHPERTQRLFRRKQDDSAAFLPIEFGWKKSRLVLSAGVVAGQKLSFAFRDPALYLSGHHGFDELPYPFRAVSTNLQTGQMFVPESGNLMKAVRASMSIPGVFPPVNWDGNLLVDGFLARNLPVDVCRSMGADIIIAVDVGELPEDTPPDNLKTMLGITKQMTDINMRQNVDPQIEISDIVIHPDLKGISAQDFKRVADTIEPGRRATEAVADQLRKLSVSDEEYAAHLERHKPLDLPPLIIDDIILKNHSRVHDKAILAKIHQQPGQELDLDILKEDLAEVYDFGVFELVDFGLEVVEGRLQLIVTTNEKYHAPNIINFGLSYEGGESGKSDVELRMRWTRMEMNDFGAEFRTDVQLGTDNLLKSEYYQPLTWKRRPFVAVTANIEHNLHNFYENLIRVAQYNSTEAFIAPDLGLRLGHFGEIRGGVEFGYLRATHHTGVSPANFEGPRGGLKGKFIFDMYDLAVLPQKGYAGLVEFFHGKPSFGSDLDYKKLSGGISGAHTFGSHTFRGLVEGGSSLDTHIPTFYQFTLGGFNRLSGYDKEQLRGNAYGLAKLSWYHRVLGHPSPYSTSLFILLQGEMGNAWPDPQMARWDDLRYSGLVSLVAKTIIGPVSVSYGQAEGGHHAFYVTIGILRASLE